MKLLIQRVLRGSVSVGGELVSQIGPGLVVLLGIHVKDNEAVAKKLAQKLPKIRLWNKDDKSWNASAQELDYEILIVSQFTLNATMKGNKPDFHLAKGAEDARVEITKLYEYFVNEIGKCYKKEKIKIGAFQQFMAVEIINDGPVTIEIEEYPEDLQENKQKQQQQIQQ